MSFYSWLIRRFYLLAVRIFFLFFTRLRVTGKENIPRSDEGPLIIVANHFSIYEVPLMALVLPKVPTYFGALELLSNPLVKYGAVGFKNEIIFVQRGKFDRQALRDAQKTLEEKGWLAIFPEGGITEMTIAMAAEGESTDHVVGHNSRPEGVLLPARPGAALLAAQTSARVLPIAFLGTERIEENLSRWRRTKVTVHVGPVFGPLILPDGQNGRSRRQVIDKFGHAMMEALAALMPPENRGYYQYIAIGES